MFTLFFKARRQIFEAVMRSELAATIRQSAVGPHIVEIAQEDAILMKPGPSTGSEFTRDEGAVPIAVSGDRHRRIGGVDERVCVTPSGKGHTGRPPVNESQI